MKNKKLLTYSFMAMLIGVSTYALASDVHFYRTPLPGVKAQASAVAGGEEAASETTCDGTTAPGEQCTHEGNEVYYVGNSTGKPLFAALAGESGGMWGTHGYMIGAGAQSRTDGKTNTATIVANVDANNGSYNGDPNAAKTCVAKGDGWYLPAIDELIELSRSPVPGGSADIWYWSSFEYGSNSARKLFMSSELEASNGKQHSVSVWCVRS